MSHLQYVQEKAKLVKSGACVIFATDAPPPTAFTPFLLTDLLFFTIYPTSERHLQANDLLWTLAQKRTYTTAQLSPFLPKSHPYLTPFALAIPPQLACFLTTVSLEDMRAAVIYMLADAAQGEDSAGLAKMQAELPTSVWKKLTALMELTAAQRNAGFGIGEGSSSGITDASFLLDAALQTAPGNDYWKISVDVAYAQQRIPAAVKQRMLSADLKNMSNAVELQEQMENARSDGKHFNIRWASVVQSLYEDFKKIAMVCEACVVSDSERLGRRRDEVDTVYGRAQELLTTLVSSNRQGATWARINTLQACSTENSSFVSWLPGHIVEQVLVPAVLTVEKEEAEIEMKQKRTNLKPELTEAQEMG